MEIDETGMFVELMESTVKNVYVGDEPLDLNKTYTVASHNYMLQNMGDGYTMFSDNEFLQDNVMLDVQVLITHNRTWRSYWRRVQRGTRKNI